MLAREREASCAAWGDGFLREQAFYGRLVKDLVFKGLTISGDGAFLVRFHHVAEDVFECLRVKYGNGERIANEVQSTHPICVSNEVC